MHRRKTELPTIKELRCLAVKDLVNAIRAGTERPRNVSFVHEGKRHTKFLITTGNLYKWHKKWQVEDV
jgi:hypothetical protein